MPKRAVDPHQRELEYRRFIRDSDEIKLHTEEFTLYPALWERCADNYHLSWKSIPFDEASQKTVPKTTGLYAFVVHPAMTNLPASAWLFYIGEAGAKNTKDRNLYKRYGEYLSEHRRVTRPKLAMLFNRYRGHIQFYYAELDAGRIDIKKIESELITAAWPIANIRDFNLRMRGPRAAFS